MAGILLDRAGQRLENVAVDVASVETWKSSSPLTTSVHTDRDGRFEFRGLPPGDDVLGVNLRGAPYRAQPRAFYTVGGEVEIIRMTWDTGRNSSVTNGTRVENDLREADAESPGLPGKTPNRD